MQRISRRSLAGGLLVVPVAGLAWAGATAGRQDATPGDSADASPEASPMASPTAVEEIVVEAQDILYDITEITIPADTDVTITLVNKGVLEHDLVIEELDIATELLRAGETGSIVVNVPAGTYEYWCTVTGHKELGMRGTLTAE